VIDLDHNATTPLDPRVREAMLGALDAGNPSSTHSRGRAARELLDGARREAARALGCEPAEVVFTASGSEANALALAGIFAARHGVSPRVLLSAVEHPSVRETAKKLRGAELVELPVDASGRMRLEDLERELAKGAAVCAAMWANNETGAVQPVDEIARLTRAAGVPFLCDAVQAAGKLPLGKVLERAEMVTLAAHKFHGPQGAGLLAVQRGLSLAPLVGGHQERGRRGGTENVAAAVGLARALTLATLDESPRIAALRDQFEHGVQRAFSDVRIHACDAPRIGNTSSVLFPGVDGEALLIALDLHGVCASLGAACASGALSPSHVLLAMGLSPEHARSSLRFSFGRENTDDEVDRVLALLTELVSRARR